MAKKKKKKDKEEEKKPSVHKDLEGFDIKINPFGEITTTVDIEQLNDFLNVYVDDLKLKHLKQKKEEE